jgi:hypothetical protein
MMIRHILLIAMFILYSIMIIYVYNQFVTKNTLSDIICNEECKNDILFFMFIMSIFTILYEIIRNDIESIIYILIILISIYGLLQNGVETIRHYIFAIFCLLCIFCFMVHHSYNTNSRVLLSLTFINYLIILCMILFIQNDIIICECLYILCFAIFYIYLHYFSL